MRQDSLCRSQSLPKGHHRPRASTRARPCIGSRRWVRRRRRHLSTRALGATTASGLPRVGALRRGPAPTAAAGSRSVGSPPCPTAIAAEATGPLRRDVPLLILDDRLVRRYALRRGLNFVGTVRLLDAAERRGLVRDAADCIARIAERGYRISPDLLEHVRKRSP